MKCILYDFRRAFTGRWFTLAAIASAAALYMSIGNDTYFLMNILRDVENSSYFPFNLSDLIVQGMRGEFGTMTFPALVTLPFAAQPLQEIKSGAIRPAVFRVGRRNWMLGKGIACILAGMLLPVIASMLLMIVMHGVMLIYCSSLFPAGDLTALLQPMAARMLCGGIWASVGCIIALLTETAAAAYLAPLCLCYALTMIGTRFFPQIAMLNPANWLTGDVWQLLFLLALLVAAVLFTLRREVLRHA